MASYKSGFDPPTRPAETSRARRLGTYMQQNAGKQERLERTEEDARRTAARPSHPAVPRPRMRDPSPSTRPKLEGTNTGSSSSSFGYSRNAPTTAQARQTPELRGKSPRNVLQRKLSSVAQEESHPNGERQDLWPTKLSSISSKRKPSLDQNTKSMEAYNEIFTRPARARTPAQASPQIYPELDRYRFIHPPQTISKNNPPKLSTQDLPPPTPLLSSSTPGYSAGSSQRRYSGYSSNGYSASPSTRFSESPGPGMYSRDTTPTSMSSQSPGIMAPSKSSTPITNTRLRQGSPAFNSNLNRPPLVTRKRTGSFNLPNPSVEVETSELPSLRESLTSSSSNSTVKDGKGKENEKKKKKRLSPMPPSPPPRKSSQKFNRSKSSEKNEFEESPSKASSAPAKPVMLSLVKPAVQVAQPATNTRPGPPTRPSREGTPDLHAQMGIMPIVQSNLSSPPLQTQIQTRRQSSLPMPRSAGPSPQLRPTRPPARNNPSPSPILHSPREGTPAPISGLGIIPSLPPPNSNSRNVSRTPSPSISNSKSRFALFGRRTKTEPHGPPLTNENKGPRKGPAAGTGHEGYGKYAARGRSASVASTRQGSLGGSVAASASTDSVATQDEFLLRRMSPVIIAGGGEIRENRNEGADLMRTESGKSLLLDRGRPSIEKQLHHEASRTTLWPSVLPYSPPQRISIDSKSRRPSDSSDSVISKSTAAQRSQFLTTANLPRPIRVGMGERTRNASTTDISLLSDESLPEISIAKKGILTKPRKLEKKTTPKEPTSKKWNFFHRSQSKAAYEREVQNPTPVQVIVGRPKNERKTVPHYALLDSSDEQLGEEATLEDLLRDAEVVGMSDGELDALQFGGEPSQQRSALRSGKEVDSRTQEEVATALGLPSPQPVRELLEESSSAAEPILFSSSGPLNAQRAVERPQVHTPPMQILFSSPEPVRPSTPPQQQPTLHAQPEPSLHLQTSLHLSEPPHRVRPSRLPQVGRIPKVVSARPETTSPKSFSRPFARLSTLQPVAQPILADAASVALGLSPGASPQKPLSPEPTAPLPSIPFTAPTSNSNSSQEANRGSGSGIAEGVEIRKSTSSKSDSASLKFLAFSPHRKGSEATTSSSSGGLSFRDTVAVIPLPEDPLEEDEMWDEYDDLLSPKSPRFPKSPRVGTGERKGGDGGIGKGDEVPVSATSSHGHPFQYEKYETRNTPPRTRKSVIQARENGDALRDSPLLKSAPTLERKFIVSDSSAYSIELSSRLKDALTTIPSPTTPLSFSEFFGGYGDRNLSVSVSQSQSQTQRFSAASSSCHSEISEGTGIGLGLSEGFMGSGLMRNDTREADEMRDIEERQRGRERVGRDRVVDLELRPGSMAVSKWLTFGHVIFSPARDEIASLSVSGEEYKVLVIDGLGNDDWSFYAAETYPSAHFYNASPSHPPSKNTHLTSPSLLPSPPNHHQIHFPFSSPSSHKPLPFKPSSFNTIIYRFPPLAPSSIYTHIISEAQRVLKPGGWLEIVVLDLDVSSMGPLTRRAVRGLKVRASEGRVRLAEGNGGREGGKVGEVGREDVFLGSVGDLVGRELGRSGCGWEGVGSFVAGLGIVGSSSSLDGGRNEDLRDGRDGDGNMTQTVARVGRWWWGRCYESGAQEGVFDSEEVLRECEDWRSSFKLFVGEARKSG